MSDFFEGRSKSLCLNLFMPSNLKDPKKIRGKLSASYSKVLFIVFLIFGSIKNMIDF